jgi:conjugal transfer pilus assembly protein TraU
MCPGALGTLPGVGMTFWQPSYLVEVQRTAGCLSSLNGLSTLSGFESLNGNERSEGLNSPASSVRRQVHWYAYPVFALLNLFSGMGCKSISGFELENLTEIDASWQDDTVASLLDPMAILTATPLATYSCIPDVVSSGFGYPLDILPYCAGDTGVIHPTSANSPIATSPEVGNQHVLYKYMVRATREARLLATIGPWSQCFSTYLPVWIKSQYRFNVVSPLLIHSPQPIVVGKSEFLWSGMPPGHTPQDTSNNILIWVGTQCCARL